MATAFQRNAFQDNAFQIEAAGLVDPGELQKRGFDETLAAFARERRRVVEEAEMLSLMDAEADLVRRAIKPFLRH